MKTHLLFAIFTTVVAVSSTAFADDSVGEKAKETARDVKTDTKKVVRSAKDKTCEMVNGKMQCAAQKIKHGTEDVMDATKDKVDDIQKK